MIGGIGHDLAEVDRFRSVLAGSKAQRFLERILTAREREHARSKEGRLAEFVAGRFAAKEAVAKALGCGIGKIISFTDIEVWPDDKGKPCIQLSAGAWERLGLSPRTTCLHVSITHERSLASAFAIVEQRQERD
ncbi:holo-ACP synthase [Paenibacillus sp. SYP-B4298]|uniref:holo-ACP synthase n=1 Tax=Paenibacillus sp. SYP-B4298 TaxID=2996034 RepID=UPI0022DE097F|nr:holo-ACP synthase [Paenibacillus sp. SYP-B4298]